jgi:phosphatidylserine/phosphatidylglycerophosphate/cardiolipin synthase-like enzyme
MGALCSNDPVCAYHAPGPHDHQPLQGAACHGCLLIAETSCEAFVTSANFTEAAQKRNIEVGVLIRHAPFAKRIADYFLALRTSGHLVRCPLA